MSFIELNRWGRRAGAAEGGQVYVNVNEIVAVIEKHEVFENRESTIVVAVRTTDGQVYPLRGRYADIKAQIDAAMTP